MVVPPKVGAASTLGFHWLPSTLPLTDVFAVGFYRTVILIDVCNRAFCLSTPKVRSLNGCAPLEAAVVRCLRHFDQCPRQLSNPAFARILTEAGAAELDVKAFWEHWEERSIAHYWEPWRPYKQICRDSLAETFAHFGIPNGDPASISLYFDAFDQFELYPDVTATLYRLVNASASLSS